AGPQAQHESGLLRRRQPAVLPGEDDDALWRRQEVGRRAGERDQELVTVSRTPAAGGGGRDAAGEPRRSASRGEAAWRRGERKGIKGQAPRRGACSFAVPDLSIGSHCWTYRC